MKRRAAALRALQKEVVSLPARAMSVWETIPDVRTTIGQFDQGSFKMGALLADEIFRDDRINGVLSTRADALTASPVKTEPADDSAQAAKVRDALGDDNDPDGLFDTIFPDEVISDLSLAGNLLSGGLAHVEWEVVDGLAIPRITPWHMQFVRYDWGERQYKVLTENQGEITLPDFTKDPHGDGEWLFWMPHGYNTAGWKRGMIRWLAELFIMRRWNQADWANYNEVHGKPVKRAYVPGNRFEGDDEFFDMVDGLGSNGTIKIPRSWDQSGKENGYGFDLVEAMARTWDTFDKFKAALDSGIAIGVLGGNLATETSEGSFAASREQTPVRIDRLRKDARLSKPLRMQVLWHFAEINFGDGKLAPRIRFDVEPPEDETEEGAAYKALGDGVNALKVAGFPVDVRAIGEARGLPMLTEEEEAAQKEEDAARAAEAMQKVAGPGGPGDAGGAGGKDPAPKGGPPKAPKAPAAPPPVKAGAHLDLGDRYLKTAPVKRYSFQGFPIAVENVKGTTRYWRDDDGNETGHTTMLHDYGYIEGVMGSDKEELDCYVGPDEAAPDVHVVHQLRAPDFKAHDEDKTMLGFPDGGAAKAAYLAHRNDGTRAFDGMSTIPVERFRAKLAERRGTGKIRASAATEAFALLEHARHTKLAAATPTAKRRARIYGDRVADKAIELAARDLGPDRRAVLEAVKQAKTPDALRAELRRLYPKLDPARLTELVFKARVMARIGGQATAVKHL